MESAVAVSGIGGASRPGGPGGRAEPRGQGGPPIPPEAAHLRLRPPCPQDGPVLWELARSAGGLDVNSPYAYLLLCRSFAQTCVLAEYGPRAVGFLSAFREPERPDTVFVWQIAVAPAHRRRGLGSALLRDLLGRPPCTGVRYLEATVTPGNGASRALFQGLAAACGTVCRAGGGFPRHLFPGPAHEPEVLLRIGPLPLPGASVGVGPDGRLKEDAHAG